LLQTLIKGFHGNSDLLENSTWEVFYAKNFAEGSPINGINPREPDIGIFIVYAKSGAIGHSGSDPGVSAFMFFHPEKKAGKIFMANEDLLPQNLNAFKSVWEDLKID
jgi:hypothetical protein